MGKDGEMAEVRLVHSVVTHVVTVAKPLQRARLNSNYYLKRFPLLPFRRNRKVEERLMSLVQDTFLGLQMTYFPFG